MFCLVINNEYESMVFTILECECTYGMYGSYYASWKCLQFHLHIHIINIRAHFEHASSFIHVLAECKHTHTQNYAHSLAQHFHIPYIHISKHTLAEYEHIHILMYEHTLQYKHMHMHMHNLNVLLPAYA